MLGDATIQSRYHMIQNQVRRAEQELAAMEKRIGTLRRKVQYYNDLLADQKADHCNPMTHARTPEQPAYSK
jgi:predicted translin family RNA/ssDNA-binding protein